MKPKGNTSPLSHANSDILAVLRQESNSDEEKTSGKEVQLESETQSQAPPSGRDGMGTGRWSKESTIRDECQTIQNEIGKEATLRQIQIREIRKREQADLRKRQELLFDRLIYDALKR